MNYHDDISYREIEKSGALLLAFGPDWEDVSEEEKEQAYLDWKARQKDEYYDRVQGRWVEGVRA